MIQNMHTEDLKMSTLGRKYTTLNLDEDLLHEAQEVLGMNRVTETIHEALREVVRGQHRRKLLEYDFPYLTPQTLEESRRSRSAIIEGELQRA